MIIQALKLALTQIDKAATWVADQIISEPKLEETMKASSDTTETALTVATTYGLGIAATYGGVALTEGLATIGANATLVQGAATLAATGTEIATGGVALASGGAEMLAIGAALLFTSRVASKVATRAVGHLNNYMTKENTEEQATAKKKLVA